MLPKSKVMSIVVNGIAASRLALEANTLLVLLIAIDDKGRRVRMRRSVAEADDTKGEINFIFGGCWRWMELSKDYVSAA